MIVQSWDCWNLDTKLSCQIDPQGALKLEYKKSLKIKPIGIKLISISKYNSHFPLFFVWGGRILETHYQQGIVEFCPAQSSTARGWAGILITKHTPATASQLASITPPTMPGKPACLGIYKCRRYCPRYDVTFTSVLVVCFDTLLKKIYLAVITELICIINYISFGSFSNRFVVNKVSWHSLYLKGINEDKLSKLNYREFLQLDSNTNFQANCERKSLTIITTISENLPQLVIQTYVDEAEILLIICF